MKTPLLNEIQMGMEKDDSFPYLVNKYLRLNKNIESLFIIGSSLNCNVFSVIFNDVKLPFLT